MSTLEHRIPPPVVALLALPFMWLLSTLLPRVDASASIRVTLSICLAAIGVGFSITGALAFRRAKTTVNPLRPESASTLVTTGVYRITRNPMYVGLMLALLGWAVFLASPLSLVGPVLFIAYINRFQIKPEEAVLRAKFGSVYEQYKSTVRRWL
jgi:protein-S-isoprenylcysteine O-methyltransferase Ste14